jgi:hypothetical protein
MGVVRRVGWSKRSPFGAEFVEANLGEDEIAARGVAIGSAPFPYRLDYEFESGARFIAARLVVTVQAENFSRRLELRRSAGGFWTETIENEGAASVGLARTPTDVGALGDALDVDLALSPLFNSTPVLRHDLLLSEGPVDLVMAWVSVPDLAVHRSPQRYSLVRRLDGGGAVVRFESLAGDDFREDITFDADGLVIDYPTIAERLR